MKKINKKIALLTVLTGLLGACNVLDTKPVDSITQDNFWNTPDEAKAAAVGPERRSAKRHHVGRRVGRPAG